MLKKNKGFSAAQSKHTSRTMNDSTIGTHVTRGGAPRHARRMNASSVGFSNSRKKRRAARGIVETVVPDTSTRESYHAYSRRVNQRGYIQDVQRKSSAKRALVGVVSVLVIALVAVGVGVAVFFNASNSKLSLVDSNAKNALVAAKDGEPYYVLCTADLGSPKGTSGPENDAYLLVRVDEASRVLTAVSIPSNLAVNLSDGKTHPLYDAETLGGDEALVNAVASFSGVSIAHIVKTDEVGLKGLVDLAGGVGVTLSEDVDDPYAGDIYLASGDQVLDGDSAVVMLRASNYTDGVETQAANRTSFMRALAERLLEAGGLDFATELDSIAQGLQTDLSSSQVISLANGLRPLSSATVYTACVPGSAGDADGTSVFNASSSQWKAVMESVNAGADPSASQETETVSDPTGITVEIRNGGGVAGVGAKMGALLGSKGFSVGTIGNVDDSGNYTDTLVIYRDEAYKAAANTIVKMIDTGRAVNGGDYYSFNTNVLVIVGKDWQPIE